MCGRFPFFALMLIGLGTYFLLRNLGVIDYNIGEFIGKYWPVLLIYFGLKAIFDRTSMKKKFRDSSFSCSDYKEADFNIDQKGELFASKSFGSYSLDLSNKKIKNGHMKFSMGEFFVDMHAVKLFPGNNKLHINTKMGGVKIKLNKDLPVQVHGTNSFGELKVFDKTGSGLTYSVQYQSPAYKRSKSRLDIYIRNSFGECIVTD
ncbi:MAG: cell wall-active antibiotics response protein [Spirochaetes bacterium]|nr:cell wall-active antibiotics response protein [Spirochaetota bacterium]